MNSASEPKERSSLNERLAASSRRSGNDHLAPFLRTAMAAGAADAGQRPWIKTTLNLSPSSPLVDKRHGLMDSWRFFTGALDRHRPRRRHRLRQEGRKVVVAGRRERGPARRSLRSCALSVRRPSHQR